MLHLLRHTKSRFRCLIYTLWTLVPFGLWSQRLALHGKVVAIEESQFIASTFPCYLNKKFGQREKRIIFKLLPKDASLELYKKCLFVLFLTEEA